MTAPAPLTTIFKPPQSCFEDLWNYSAHDHDRLGPSPTARECYPDGFDFDDVAFFFSPGVCPSGYQAAETSVADAGSMAETYITCCPTNYAYTYGGCESYYAGVGYHAITQWYSDGEYKGISTNPDAYGTATASPIQVRYKENDLLTVYATDAQINVQATVTAFAVKIKMNAGQKAVLGAGWTLAGILLLILIGILLFSSRRVAQMRESTAAIRKRREEGAKQRAEQQRVRKEKEDRAKEAQRVEQQREEEKRKAEWNRAIELQRQRDEEERRRMEEGNRQREEMQRRWREEQGYGVAIDNSY